MATHVLSDICERLLARARARGMAQVEVIASQRQVGATRFAVNSITQHQEQHFSDLRVRVLLDDRQGVATGSSYSDDALDALLTSANNAATYASADPQMLPLIDKQPSYTSVESFDEATAKVPASVRADAVAGAIGHARELGVEAAGLLNAGWNESCYATSTGVHAAYRATQAGFTMSAFAGEQKVEGMADCTGRRFADLDVAACARTAVDKSLKSQQQSVVPPGAYTVLLEPSAVSDLLLFLTRLGFSSLAHIEKRTGLAGRMGQEVFSPLLSVRSDPCDPRHQGCPYDAEGFPRQALTLIEAGVPKELPQDRRTALRMQAANTGHANPQPDSMGPMPGCIVVAPGPQTQAEMLANIEDGLLISHLHYTNVVDPMRLSLTGMTRGGTWRIRNGELAEAVSDFRYTESLLDAFKNLRAIGSEARLCGGGLFGGGMVLPAMVIDGMHFTSGR